MAFCGWVQQCSIGRQCFVSSIGRVFRRSSAGSSLLAGIVLLALSAIAGPAHALSCPDDTGHNNANPVNVTYYLTEMGCTKSNPGSGVKLQALVTDSSAFVTFSQSGQAAPAVSTSFTTGVGCTNAGSSSSANAARYSYGNSAICRTTVRLGNGAEFSFVASNDGLGFASSLTSVRFSVPPTRSTFSQTPSLPTFGQSVTLNVSVSGGVAPPTGVATITENGTLLGAPTLVTAPTSGLSVVSIASGATSSHACAIMTNGGVKCWGRNDDGQLGNGLTTSSSVPVDVQSLTGVVALALGTSHSCALTMSGGVKCWGSNALNQLGSGGPSSATPVDVNGLTSGMTAIAVGNAHGCALTLAGGVKCWGLNSEGQLGNGGFASAAIAADVPALTSGVAAIAAGGGRSCAILASTAGLQCWGSNAAGGVGDNSTTPRPTPTDVAGLTSGVALVSVGNDHTCAVDTIGAAKCWGSNTSGQLGDGTASSASLVPVAVSTLDSGVKTISAGSDHTCALTTLAEARCWGSSSSGQVGDGQLVLRNSPVNVQSLGRRVLSVVSANSSTYAVTTELGAKSWGSNGSGRLGDGLSVNRTLPFDVSGLGSGQARASLVTSSLTAGNHSISIDYGGDFNRTGSSGVGGVIPVLQAQSTTLLIVAPATSSTFNQSATLTASVGSSVGTPTGTVNFKEVSSGVSYGTASLNAQGIATLSLSTLTVGVHSLRAVYSGDVNYLGNSSTLVYTVNKGPTGVTLVSPTSDPTLVNDAVTLNGTVLATFGGGVPSGTVTFADSVHGTLGTATLNAGVASLSTTALAAGSHSISAVYNGDANFAVGGSGTLSRSVNKRSNIISFPTLPNTPFTSAPPIPGATASSGLTVTYSSATPAICSASSAGSVSLLSAGTCSITASQAGNATFLAAASVTQSFSVTPGVNTITFPALPNTVFGAAPPVPAATASSSLTVTYTSTTTPVCTTTSAGVITLVSAGTCSITASQAGNANFLAAAPVSISFTVTKAGTTTVLAASSASIAFGESVTLTATIAAVAPANATPSGNVTFFRAGSVAIGTAAVSAGQAVLTTAALPAGANSITARYDVAGSDPSLSTSTSAAVAVNVAQQATTTTLAASRNPVSVGTALALTATVGAGATGNVSFSDGTSTLATVALIGGAASTSFTPSVAGPLSLTATYAGDANFTASTSAALQLLAFSSCDDSFAAALPVTGANGTVFGTTAGATGEAGEPNHAGNSGALNSVWCRWTAPAAGSVTFDTTGSSFDTTLAVYTGAAVNALTQVAANNNIAAGNTRSRVTFAATAGTVYRIAIDGVSATGTFVLNFAQAPAAPATFASVLPTARSITTKTVATAFATMINCRHDAGDRLFARRAARLPGRLQLPGHQCRQRAGRHGQHAADHRARRGAGLRLLGDAAGRPQQFGTRRRLRLRQHADDRDRARPQHAAAVILVGAGSRPDLDRLDAIGDGIANIPGATGVTAFGAATVNIGAAGTVTASVDDNGAGLRADRAAVRHQPDDGRLHQPGARPAPSATFTLATNASATVAVFVTGTGNVPFDPANNRLFLRFKTADGVTRGATSVAVRTQ